MRDIPPTPPIESKGKEKEALRADADEQDVYPVSQFTRARARTRESRRRFVDKWRKQIFDETENDLPRYAVERAVEVTGGNENDRRIWLKIANRGANTVCNLLSEFEYDLARLLANGHDYRSRPAAFQRRLNAVLPRKGGAK